MLIKKPTAQSPVWVGSKPADEKVVYSSTEARHN